MTDSPEIVPTQHSFLESFSAIKAQVAVAKSLLGGPGSHHVGVRLLALVETE